MKYLINCVVFLGKQEMANKSNYLELLDLVAEYDRDLRTHLATSTVFSGTSLKI